MPTRQVTVEQINNITRDTALGGLLTPSGFTYAGGGSITASSSYNRVKLLNDTDHVVSIADEPRIKLYAGTDEIFLPQRITIKTFIVQNISVADGLFLDINRVVGANSALTDNSIFGIHFVPLGAALDLTINSSDVIHLRAASDGNVLVTVKLNNA